MWRSKARDRIRISAWYLGCKKALAPYSHHLASVSYDWYPFDTEFSDCLYAVTLHRISPSQVVDTIRSFPNPHHESELVRVPKRNLAMGAPSTLLVIVAALTVLQSATAITQTVAAKGCTGYRFTLALESFNFTSFMGDYTVPSTCNRTDIKCAYHACPLLSLLEYNGPPLQQPQECTGQRGEVHSFAPFH